MDKLTQAIADLNFCSEVIDRERFAGLDQNPKGVRDLLYSAIKTVERETQPRPTSAGLVEELTGALRFILAFYDPGQRHLDTEAWKAAEAGGRRALARGEAAIAKAEGRSTE